MRRSTTGGAIVEPACTFESSRIAAFSNATSREPRTAWNADPTLSASTPITSRTLITSRFIVLRGFQTSGVRNRAAVEKEMEPGHILAPYFPASRRSGSRASVRSWPSASPAPVTWGRLVPAHRYPPPQPVARPCAGGRRGLPRRAAMHHRPGGGDQGGDLRPERAGPSAASRGTARWELRLTPRAGVGVSLPGDRRRLGRPPATSPATVPVACSDVSAAARRW